MKHPSTGITTELARNVSHLGKLSFPETDDWKRKTQRFVFTDDFFVKMIVSETCGPIRLHDAFVIRQDRKLLQDKILNKHNCCSLSTTQI